MRYLGISFISWKLEATDCKIIVARAKNWTNRVVSYAGRLQLVNSILFAIQVYWALLFIHAKVVIKQVKGALRTFLWPSSDLNSKRTKIPWNEVCLPKEEGHRVIKNMEHWN